MRPHIQTSHFVQFPINHWHIWKDILFLFFLFLTIVDSISTPVALDYPIRFYFHFKLNHVLTIHNFLCMDTIHTDCNIVDFMNMWRDRGMDEEEGLMARYEQKLAVISFSWIVQYIYLFFLLPNIFLFIFFGVIKKEQKMKFFNNKKKSTLND